MLKFFQAEPFECYSMPLLWQSFFITIYSNIRFIWDSQLYEVHTWKEFIFFNQCPQLCNVNFPSLLGSRFLMTSWADSITSFFFIKKSSLQLQSHILSSSQGKHGLGPRNLERSMICFLISLLSTRVKWKVIVCLSGTYVSLLSSACMLLAALGKNTEQRDRNLFVLFGLKGQWSFFYCQLSYSGQCW